MTISCLRNTTARAYTTVQGFIKVVVLNSVIPPMVRSNCIISSVMPLQCGSIENTNLR